MDFLLRAQKALDRGDAVRGLVQLVEGLRRHPERDDARDLLLFVYTRQIEHPGVESDVLRALEGQSARGELLGLLEVDLRERGKDSMARALMQLARERGVPVIAPVPPDKPGDETSEEVSEDRSANAEARFSDAVSEVDEEDISADAKIADDAIADDASRPAGDGNQPSDGSEVLSTSSTRSVASGADQVDVERMRVLGKEAGLPTTDEIERRRAQRPPRRRAAIVAIVLLALVIVGATTWAGWDHAQRARLISSVDGALIGLNHLDEGLLDAVLSEATRGHRQDRYVVEREAFARAVRAAEFPDEREQRRAIKEMLDGEVTTEWGMAARSLLASAEGDWEEATEYAVLTERTQPARLAALYARGRLCEARAQWSCALGAYQRLLGRHSEFSPARAAMMRLAAHRFDRDLWEHHRVELVREVEDHCYGRLTWIDPFAEVVSESDAADELPPVGSAGGDAFCVAWSDLAQAKGTLSEDRAAALAQTAGAVGWVPPFAVGQVIAGVASASAYDPEAARDYFMAALSDAGLRSEFYLNVQAVGPQSLVALARPDLALALTIAVEEGPSLLTDPEAQTRASTIERREAARPAHLSAPPEAMDDAVARARVARAQVLRELGAGDHAVRALEPLLSMEGWADQARLELVAAHIVGGHQRSAETVVGQIQDAELRDAAHARLALASGRFEDAVDPPQRPTRWEDRRSRALGYLALRRGRDAAAALDQSLALEPTRLRVYARLGELPESYAADMERWNQVDPRGVSHLVDLGAAAFWQRDLERAHAYFEQALELAPDHPEVNWQMGLLARLDDANAEARGYFRKSWRGDENDASLLIELGRVHLDFERYEMAREAFLLATLRDRRNVSAVAGLGRAYELGDPARGRRDLPQLLRDYSSSPRYAPAVAEMNKWLAILHGAREGDEAAAPYLERARDAVGDRADVLVELGRYHLAREEAEQARENFALALQKNPTLPAPHWGLAELALDAGDAERATDHLSRLEGLGADAAWPERIDATRQRLSRLRERDGAEGSE